MLNPTQRNIIEGMLSFTFEEIQELPPTHAITALEAMLCTTLEPAQMKAINADIQPCVEQVRAIFLHPCPQNRSTNYPYFGAPYDPNMVVYKNSEGKPAFESKGLLSLSARNDPAIESVTKSDVIEYITVLIRNEIYKAHEANLNPLQKETLERLKQYGFTIQHLLQAEWSQSRYDKKIEFRPEHKDALVHLICERKFTPEEAIAQINNLDFYQVTAMMAGFSRTDVVRAPHLFSQAFMKLNPNVFTVDLRSTLYDSIRNIGEGIIAGLNHLVENAQLSPEAAIEQIKTFDDKQALYLSKGLSADEVRGLNLFPLQALFELKPHGLTSSILRSYKSASGGDIEYFSRGQYDALVYLIKTSGMPAKRAMQEMNGLWGEAHHAISKGISRAELTQVDYPLYQALIELKQDGVKAAHLKKWHSPYKFSGLHLKALCYLIRTQNKSPDEAVEIITNLDSTQAGRIANGKTLDDPPQLRPF